ncbi:alpha-lytic protease prodomain-containing protein [Streptomyces sp. NPDC012794]|uniref:alpha-lytic protease prodomain-containing protein n=1 Tax=Streptomyces sp. NPDC012794 TaxID=3364850 RepID=UPI00368E0434
MAALNAGKAIPGTAWVHDVKANKAVVTAYRTVRGKTQDQLHTMLKPLDDTVQLERTDSEFRIRLMGGERIVGFAAGTDCTVGFNVKRAGKPNAFRFPGTAPPRTSSVPSSAEAARPSTRRPCPPMTPSSTGR